MINQTTIPTQSDFDTALEHVSGAIHASLSSKIPLIGNITRHLQRAKGKQIRARSVLACAEDSDGMIAGDAVLLAAAVELLHLATLVHDDVIDNAKLRRGEKTLHTLFGKKQAVICGDYLFCLALQTAAGIRKRPEETDLLPGYMTRICLGELRQNANLRNYDMSAFEYFRVISGKTAALFEASFLGGFEFSGEDKAQKQKYKRLGHYIGMIFQLSDDCVDYEGNEKTAKKTVLSDYRQGVITLPLIYTLSKMPRLKESAARSALSADEIGEAVRESEGLGYTRELIRKYYDKARDILDSLSVSEQKRARLSEILNQSLNGISLS